MEANNLNIGLIGYGKMGKTIESLAHINNHDIGLKTTSRNLLSDNIGVLNKIDVAIEFTNPEIVKENLKTLASNKVPTVCGSTGWLEDYEEIIHLFNKNETPFIYASNFSIGVNAFFALNKYLANLMASIKEYSPSIMENHHLEKKDAPSGTAITLANDIIPCYKQLDKWHNSKDEKEGSLPILSIREPDVKGLHEITYESKIDRIQITHEAFNRDGFALGALKAAEFIYNKKGIFTMQDVLQLDL